MEAIGGIASVLQLVQAVGLIANGVVIACQRLHNAPKEFSEISCQASWFNSHLKNCEGTLTIISPHLLTSDIELSLILTLTEATSCLLELERVLSCVNNVSSIDARVRWATHSRGKAGKSLRRLENCRERIASNMQLLDL